MKGNFLKPILVCALEKMEGQGSREPTIWSKPWRTRAINVVYCLYASNQTANLHASLALPYFIWKKTHPIAR